MPLAFFTSGFKHNKIINKILLYDVTFNMISLLHYSYIIKISVGIVYVTYIFPNIIF